jgi:hypothetical protein
MAVTAEIVMQLTAAQTLAGVGVAVGTKVIQSGLNSRVSLSGDTVPPLTKVSFLSKTLAAGAGTIDLTSLPDVNNIAAAVDFTGLKLQSMIIQTPSANTAAIVLSKAASNGYGLDSGGATWTLPVPPGSKLLITFNDNLPDVGGSAKNITLAGSGTDSLTMGMVAG